MNKTIYLLLFLLTSCGFSDINFDNVEVEEWRPTFAIPIFKGNIRVADMVATTDSSFLQVREDGLLQFVYSQNVLSFNVDELVEVPDITPPAQSFSAPFPGTLPFDFQSPTETIQVDLDIDPTELYSIELKSGNVVFTFNSSFDFEIDLTIEIPTAKFGGNFFSQLIVIPANTNNFQQVLNLSDYTLDCTDKSGNSTPNKFPIEFSVFLKAGSTVQFGDKIDLVSSIENIRHKVVYCNLTQIEVPLPTDTLLITAYNNTFDISNLALDSPSLSFEIINRYGIPFNFDFVDNSPVAVETSSNERIGVEIPSLPTFIAGFSKENNFNIVNFPAIFNLRPDEIRYESVGQINPNMPATINNPNIIVDTSNVEGIATAILPFIGSGSLEFFGDTTDVDLSLDDDIDEFLSATIKIIINSSVPLDANVQFYFMDDNFNVIDSVLSPQNTFFAGAEVNANGRPINETEIIVEEVLDVARLERIVRTRKMTLIGTFSTKNNQSVRIHNDDLFKVQVGLLTNVKISLEE